MQPSPDALAAAIVELRNRNPMHILYLPAGCNRAEAEQLEIQEQEAHPWNNLIVVRYVAPGDEDWD